MDDNNLEKILLKFLQFHYDVDRPVLLGLSGGPDSLALFQLLLLYKEAHPINFAVAHINHNWREESKSEALQLLEMAKRFHISFHLKEIYPEQLQGNLEASSRLERLRFFGELCRENDYQAVLLGHHADDQAETVLKRVLEGADLTRLGGLKEIANIEGATLWRPFLSIAKKDILSWISLKELVPFQDHTNLDPRFLRGKFRSQIIPELSRNFGKEVSANLCHLGTEAQELRDYFKERVQLYLSRIETGIRGSFLDLSTECPQARYELKYLLKEWLANEEIILSRDAISTICNLVVEKAANRSIALGNAILYIDRGRIFLQKVHPCDLLAIHSVKIGESKFGPWKVKVKYVSDRISKPLKGWKGVWDGYLEAILPEGEFTLETPVMNSPYPGNSSISKWWNDHKVPAFLRHQVPVVKQGDVIQHEFLTHRYKPGSPAATKWMYISLHYIPKYP